MTIIIHISKNNIDILKKHAQDAFPIESCAILLGNIMDSRYTVKEVFLTKNIEDSTVSFTMSNDELMQAYTYAEKAGFEIIGIFHSHPESIAYPSTMDRMYMEINPVPWVIFSNLNDEFKGYIFDSEFVPVIIDVM